MSEGAVTQQRLFGACLAVGLLVAWMLSYPYCSWAALRQKQFSVVAVLCDGALEGNIILRPLAEQGLAYGWTAQGFNLGRALSRAWIVGFERRVVVHVGMPARYARGAVSYHVALPIWFVGLGVGAVHRMRRYWVRRRLRNLGGV